MADEKVAFGLHAQQQHSTPMYDPTFHTQQQHSTQMYDPTAPPHHHHPQPPHHHHPQPPPHLYPHHVNQFPPPNSGAWTSNLCGCTDDCSSCCCACWCPCVPVGRIANILDKGTTSAFEGGAIFFLTQCLFGLGFLYTCTYRAKLRTQFGLPEDPCNDICTDCCCLCCSISQVYRELKNRKIDPKLGYEAVSYIYEQPPQEQQMRRV